MKFIILGDVHIGKSTRIGKPGAGQEINSRIKDQLDLLDWVLSTALLQSVDTIIITGDVYEDPRPHPALINFFMLWLKKCEKSGVKVHVVAGNHDIIRTGSYTSSALDIVPSVEMELANVYKNVSVLHFDGVSVTLVPYRDRRMYEVETTAEALTLLTAEIERERGLTPVTQTEVMVGHLAFEGSICIGDEIDDQLNEIFCPASVFAAWDFVWMGHVHNPQVISKAKPYAAHIGSMERSDFSKAEMTNDKILVLFDSKTKTFEHIKIPNRSIHKIELIVPQDKDTTDFIINYLCVFDKTKSLKDCILKLEIQLSQDVPNAERTKILDYLYKTLEVHYVCQFTESRMMESTILIDSVINDSISPAAAINVYWDELKDIEDDEREACRALSLQINSEFEEAQIK